MHPKQLLIKDFTYQLPDERIAKYPLAERDLSKLLVYKAGSIDEDVYRNLHRHLPTGSLLVFNNTKVIPARVLMKNANGATIEIFCLEPHGENWEMARAMSKTGSARWNCLVGRASKWKEKLLHHTGSDFTLSAELVERTTDAFVVEFTWTPENLSFAEILDRTGNMPIPPYLHRQTEEIDLTRYQTVYAENKGSVAAPTAGLHFTPQLFEQLKQKQIETAYLTLHVGAGTFKPVKAERIADHEMHAEVIDVSLELIETLCKRLAEANQAPIVAIGTTSLRTLESLYYLGVKVMNNAGMDVHDLSVQQWEPYDNAKNIDAAIAVNALLNYMHQKKLKRLVCKTGIMIAPGYELRIADALITNFHQPNSTLLLLVAAVVGNDWKKIYDYALTHDFRFLSYGDGSLIWKRQAKK